RGRRRRRARQGARGIRRGRGRKPRGRRRAQADAARGRRRRGGGSGNVSGRRKDPTFGALGRSPAKRAPSFPPEPMEMPPERGAVRRWIHAAMFDNVALKFLSMVLAVTVFLLVNTDRDREVSGRVRLTYNVPDDRVLTSPRVEDVQVTLRGSGRRLRRFSINEIDAINLDLTKGQSGEVAITPDMIHVPAGF